MNFTRTDVGELHAVLNLKVTKEDYKDRLDKRLKDARKNFVIDGFRPGQVPMGIIQKRFGKSLLVEEVLNTVQDGLFKYIKDNNLRTLGEPLEVEEVNNANTFEGSEEFEFAFELGFSPEVNVDLSKLTLPYYEIIVDEKAINLQIDEIRNRNAKPVKAEAIDGDRCMVRGDLVETEAAEGQEAKQYLDIILSLRDMANDDAKKLLEGAKLHDTIAINPAKDFAPESISYILKIKKDDIEAVNKEFSFSISEITNFEAAELNEELYSNVFPGEEIADEAAFRARVGKWIESYLAEEGNAKLFFDGRKKLVEETNITLPAAFLKKWLLKTNKSETATAEKLEEEFPNIEVDFKWQLIKEKILVDSNSKITEDEIMQQALVSTRDQLYRMGYYQFTEEQLQGYAASLAKKEDERNRFIDFIGNDKVTLQLKEKATLTTQPISREDYNKLVEADQKTM